MFSKLSSRKAAATRLACGVLLLLGLGVSQAQEARTLQAMDFVALDGDRVVFTFTLSEPAPEPVVFSIDKPARLSMDFPDTRLAITERYRRVNVGKARAIAVAEAKDRTRVVIELSELASHTVRVEGNKVMLTVDGSGTAAPIPLTGSPVVVRSAGAGPVASTVRGVDFRRGEKGEGRVSVSLSDPRATVDVRQEGVNVVAVFKNTGVSEGLVRRLDVIDFATPVKFIDTTRVGVDTKIVITPAAGTEYEQVAYQSGDQFTLELQPLTKEKLAERKRSEPEYTGERISLSFQNVDVRSLLQIIADVAGVNMVVSDSVKGEVAMRLQNVPWDQALDIILRTKGLGMRQQGNVILIAPAAELLKQEQDRILADATQTELAPVRLEVIQINYARAADIKKLLTDDQGGGSGGGQGGGGGGGGGAAGVGSGAPGVRVGFISSRGSITVDERTNTLLVQETSDRLQAIREVIAQLDIPTRQVLVESRVVVASSDFSKELGARFGVQHFNTINNAVVGTTATANDTRGLLNDLFDGDGDFQFPGVFNVSLPPTSSAGTVGFVLGGLDYVIDLELSAMQLEGRGEIIATPRVITADGQEAVIKQGVDIPYTTLAAPTGGGGEGVTITTAIPQVSFKEAVLSLTVKPRITPDNSIIMDLTVTRNEPDFARAVQGNPPLNKREVKTQVRVKHGDTLVLGGVYEQTIAGRVEKVPLLGDIPIIGTAFRRTADTDNKRELLIFVTPKIVEDGLRVD